MTEKDYEVLAKVTVETIKQALDRRVGPLEARLAELEAGLATALKAGVTWQRGATYRLNDSVVHDGSLWRCIEPHVSGETFGHDRFVLQVKHGRDGKDLR